MKKLLISFLLVVSAIAAPRVSITDTITRQDGTPFVGILTIRLNQACYQDDGQYVDSTTATIVQIGTGEPGASPAGELDVALYPNATGSCGPPNIPQDEATSYNVRYEDTENPAGSRFEYWSIPTGGPYKIMDVMIPPPPPTPGIAVQPQNILPGGADDQDHLVFQADSGTYQPSPATGGPPDPHAPTHQDGGSDEVATATAAPGAIPKAAPSGQLDIAFLASGTPDGTKYVRDDGTLQTPPGTGGGAAPGVSNIQEFPFSAVDTVTITNAQHNCNTVSMLVQVRDDQSPEAYEIPPVTAHPTTFEVQVLYPTGSSHAGTVYLDCNPLNYTEQVSGTTWSIPAANHGYDTSSMLVQVWSNDTPRQLILAPVTVNASTLEVAGDFSGLNLTAHPVIGGNAGTGGGGGGTNDHSALINLDFSVAGHTGVLAPANLPVMVGAGGPGVQGAVPAPGAGDAANCLKGDATWGACAGGGGATMGSQLGDFEVTRTSSTVLTIGANCAPATPCNYQDDDTAYQVTAPMTATISAGSATAYVYADGATIYVGTNGDTVVCAGCTHDPAVSAFPGGSVIFATWTASSGTWVDAGGADLRSLYNASSYVAGTAISIAGRVISVDTAAVGLRVAVPATASSACNVGEWAMGTGGDNNFYWCKAANTWLRVLGATW